MLGLASTAVESGNGDSIPYTMDRERIGLGEGLNLGTAGRVDDEKRADHRLPVIGLERTGEDHRDAVKLICLDEAAMGTVMLQAKG